MRPVAVWWETLRELLGSRGLRIRDPFVVGFGLRGEGL